ncbi:ATP-dependent DNA helicase PIF1 [Exaiptasia diaphana]|nr:ATP-dependent DNA helicase PIF1 [Exaiptasia diaphana]
MRGSPHLHALIWTSHCPKLKKDNKQAYIDFIDKHVQAYLPDENEDPHLHELVKTYQKHSHSKTCRKYKNIRCRFNFGQFFTNRTIVAEPLSNDMNEDIKISTLEKRKEILTLVKEKIDDVLNPSKPNYDSTLTESDIFNSVGITKEQYYGALSISPDSDYELHLKRPIDSCFINNYFIAGIKGFAANVDLQPVFNHYKCVTYVCSYFTKDETECSQAIMNVAKEAKVANMNVREGLKKIGAAFLSTREVSSQEAVYRCVPELWLRKIFPAAVFISTDLPDKRIRMAKSQKELEELDDKNAVTEALENLRNNQGNIHSYDSMNDQENDDIHSQLEEQANAEESFNEQIPSQLSSSDPESNNHQASAISRHVAVNPELPSVLLMAPTGVAAININGTTINTALGIPKEAGSTLKPLSDQNRTQLRLFLSELRLIIVDEISMVGNTTLLHIHQRLKEIFATPASKLFAGISIIAGGDFYQLPPIKKKPVFDNFNIDTYNLCHPWHLFRMTELIDNMRSKDDQPFVEMLNRFRTASQTEQDIKHIQSRSIHPEAENYPSDAIHIYAENKPVDEHNNTKLTQLPGTVFNLRAADQYPPNVSKTDIDIVLSKGRSDTGGLDYVIHVKEGARVMLTSNIDIADRLINGQIGSIIKIHVNQNTHKPSVIYIKFDDEQAGKNKIRKMTLHGQPNTTKDGLVILDKCAITDSSTASVKLTLWNDLIDEIHDKSCYVLTNVRVKEYDSKKYITATPNTTAEKSKGTFPEPGPETTSDLFDIHVIQADKVELLDNYKKYFCCRACNKALTEISRKGVIKCQCGVLQELEVCPQIAAIRLQVNKGNNELIWLTAFQPVLEHLLEGADDHIHLDADEQVISTFLFGKLKNFTLKYQGNIVKDITL